MTTTALFPHVLKHNTGGMSQDAPEQPTTGHGLIGRLHPFCAHRIKPTKNQIVLGDLTRVLKTWEIFSTVLSYLHEDCALGQLSFYSKNSQLKNTQL